MMTAVASVSSVDRDRYWTERTGNRFVDPCGAKSPRGAWPNRNSFRTVNTSKSWAVFTHDGAPATAVTEFESGLLDEPFCDEPR